MGQMADFKGFAEVIRDYQKSVQLLDENEPVGFWGNTGVAVGGGSEMRCGGCAAHGDLPKDEGRASRE